MKRQFPLLAAFLLLGIFCQAQSPVIINRADVAIPGSIYLVQYIQSTPELDLSPEGADCIWNFSELPEGMAVNESYLAMRDVNPGFAYSMQAQKPNIVMETGSGMLDTLLGGSLGNAYFFYQSGVKYFGQVGLGTVLQDQAIAFPYSSPDVLYSFPLSYGKNDSSFSSFEIGFPGLFYFKREQQRVNKVDAWGKLTTPYGTWDVIRLRSELKSRDTIATSDSTGMRMEPMTTIEYHWLAKGIGIPVMVVTGTITDDTFVPELVKLYEKNQNPVSTSINAEEQAGTISIYPNPAYSDISIVSPEIGNAILSDILGKEVLFKELIKGVNVIDISHLTPGIYILTLDSGDLQSQQKLIISSK
ncbi:MAG: T9SS type A sorting domain-containing protein [Bacteroidota bacterium]|nr:T9SS type A sorting domain-containing protein [Bacteroidota bacterium]